MRLEEEFVVRKPRPEVAAILDRDETVRAMFPDAEVIALADGTREARACFSGLGAPRDVRVQLRTDPSGDLRFDKVCDGNVWRSLSGEVRLLAVNERTTRVVVSMEGRTHALVPELTVRAPAREQLGQLARALRSCLQAA
jgi:carbon monoxide dehydrogenase subunit G